MVAVQRRQRTISPSTIAAGAHRATISSSSTELDELELAESNAGQTVRRALAGTGAAEAQVRRRRRDVGADFGLVARAVVVDANVERVVARVFAIADPLPGAKAAVRFAAGQITPDVRAGDFAQAMMDLGATICTSRAPRCLLCPLAEECKGRTLGPERFPVKPPKSVIQAPSPFRASMLMQRRLIRASTIGTVCCASRTIGTLTGPRGCTSSIGASPPVARTSGARGLRSTNPPHPPSSVFLQAQLDPLKTHLTPTKNIYKTNF